MLTDFSGKTVVVTGGASGIGAALVGRFVAQQAQVVVFDLNEALPDTCHGSEIIQCDVTDETALEAAIEYVEKTYGAIDIFVSNAGVLSDQPGHAASATNDHWARCMAVNVMAHVFAARCLLPKMIARGGGHFVTVASAAGLLNQIGDAAYSASKHAAVSFAESLAITHAQDGITVTLACPQYVATPMLRLDDAAAKHHAGLLTADEVAVSILTAVQDRRFLVLPHEQVATYVGLRATEHDRWIAGMVKLKARLVGKAGPMDMYRLI